MAKVTLRGYNREIESLIGSGQLNEAAAHCQHILKTFPMHVETYRIMGKCFLEGRHYTDAADIFQRVLMAVPDDFVAHVGMSIIRDDEGRLDDAIWHMERAFEDQPSNPAIQGELRRLYGRRDGVEPAKIRLSRDALANMYSQGELFNQAIAEMRAVLAEDSNRPDLQVMLARAYFRAGQKVEAAEMAATLLKKYIYCMDPLRILVDVLPGTGHGDDTQIYRQRLRMLDPYSAFSSSTTFGSDQVADTAVNLERLEYNKDANPSGIQPDWAASLGIKLADEKPNEKAPIWMKTGDAEKVSPQGAVKPGEKDTTLPTDGESIPDWMRSAGWEESGEKPGEVTPSSNVESPAEPIAAAEIPEWLKSLAPQEAESQIPASQPGNKPPSFSMEDGVTPEWLAGMGIAAVEEKADLSKKVPSIQDKDAFPDWLGNLEGEGSDQTEKLFSPKSEGAKEEESSTPSEPISLSSETPKPIIASESVNPASLSPEETVSALKIPTDEPAPEIASIDVPKENAGEQKISDESSVPPSNQAKPIDIEEDAMAWLESLASKQGVKEDELLTSAEDRSGEMPDWLKKSDDQNVIPPASEVKISDAMVEPGLADTNNPLPGKLAGEKPVSPETSLPSSVPPAESVKPSTSEGDVATWLRNLGLDQEPMGEVQENSADVKSEDIPDWLLTPIEPPASQELKESSQTSGVTMPLKPMTSPSIEPQIPPSTPSQPAQAEDITITSWLSKKDVEEALGKNLNAPKEPLGPSEAQEELPDWLKDLEKAPSSQESAKPADELPEWLQRSATSERQGSPVVVPESIPSPEPEIPTWVDETPPVSTPPSPTTPEDWVPMDVKVESGTEIPHVTEPLPEVPEPPKQTPVELQSTLPARTQIKTPFPKGTGVLSRVPTQEKDADILSAAQAALNANRLTEAMQLYSKLIKKNRLLDEVIHDLREAIYRFPVDIIIWQTLGDASMRANRLQDALDAYTKAEELLR